MIAGVAYQCPAGPIRLAEKIRQNGSPNEASSAFATSYALCESRNQFERLQVVALDVCPDHMKLFSWPLHEGANQVVVSREHGDKAVVTWVELDATD
jgi:hypothetical protein